MKGVIKNKKYLQVTVILREVGLYFGEFLEIQIKNKLRISKLRKVEINSQF